MAYVRVKHRRGVVSLEKHLNNLARTKSHEIGLQIKNRCKELAPVDTGKLRDSIKMETYRKNAVTVFIDGKKAPHANYVIGGHKPMHKEKGYYRFQTKEMRGSDKYIFAKNIKRVEPNNFMHKALMDVKKKRRTNAKASYNKNIQ